MLDAAAKCMSQKGGFTLSVKDRQTDSWRNKALAELNHSTICLL